jgi:2-oxo-3-hexenedioate decarboxylase
VIADNTSSSRFVVGGRMRHLADLDRSTLGVVLDKNREIVTMPPALPCSAIRWRQS